MAPERAPREPNVRPTARTEKKNRAKAASRERADFRKLRRRSSATLRRAPSPARIATTRVSSLEMLSTTARLGVAPSARVAPAPRGVSSRSSRPILTIPRASRLVVHAAGPTANDQGMYDGTVFFHLYPELSSPKPIFNTFLEGALHCAEVARSHPAYQTAHFHEAHDQELAIDCKPHGYFNMTLFSCAPENLWSEFEDLHECLDIGHMNQEHHPLPCREIAAFPGPESAVSSAPHGAARVRRAGRDGARGGSRGPRPGPERVDDVGGRRSRADGVRGDVLGRDAARVRGRGGEVFARREVELGAASDDAVAAATEAARAGAGEGSVVGAFRCAFNIEKTGTPAGAFPAVREMQKKAKANEAEKSAAEKAEAAAAVKSGTV